MQISISINGTNPDLRAAGKQLHLLADQMKAGVVHVEGFNVDFMGEFSLDVDLGDVYAHGDYQDGEGNLLHVANDHVVNVTWANKDAEVEQVEVLVEDWMEKHGRIYPAGRPGEGGWAAEHGH